jgi:plasmid stabilization system protein ParE
MTHAVVFSAQAEADLFAIYDYIAERPGADIALRFTESIEEYCLGFAHSRERGTNATICVRDCGRWDSGDERRSCLRWIAMHARS